MLAHPDSGHTLFVTPWEDPVVDLVGYDPRSEYVEKFWLGVLGPSAVWLLRHLAYRFDAEPTGFAIDTADLARALGLGAGASRHAPLGRTVVRCCQFGMAHQFPGQRLTVRRVLPLVARHHLNRLPAPLQHEHAAYEPAPEHTAVPAAPPAWAQVPQAGAPLSSNRARARQMALSLADAGEDCGAIIDQLHTWRFAPDIAAEAARWAAERAGVAEPAQLLGTAKDSSRETSSLTP